MEFFKPVNGNSLRSFFAANHRLLRDCINDKGNNVSDSQAISRFQIGKIDVSVEHNSLHLGSESVRLQPKAMAVLAYLAAHHNRVISAQELMDNIWRGRVVTQGSVQKSINAIRSALAELEPQTEFIQFYSKRGYQLIGKISDNQPQIDYRDINAPKPTEIKEPVQNAKQRVDYRLARLVLIAITLIAIGLSLFKRQPAYHHKTQFSEWQLITSQPGNERSATPHPDNLHLAYVSENFINPQGETESHLYIRNEQGEDWQIALSKGSWFKLAWSPSGTHLAVVEVNHIDERSLKPNFYDSANFIYSFHIFTLDLHQRKLLEKQTLSQWQGRISSLSWWDEDTLEFVAKQGPNANFARYRYARTNQQLTQIDDPEGVHNIIASAIFQSETAVVSEHNNRTEIHFLNARQKPISQYVLEKNHIEISWIPDGSGLLVFNEEAQNLFLLYRNGDQTTVPLEKTIDTQYSRAHFGPKGDHIYLTQERRQANLFEVSASIKINLTNNNYLNFGGIYSADGQQIFYASKRENGLHLYQRKGAEEFRLTNKPIENRLGALVWSAHDASLYYTAGKAIYQLALNKGEPVLLFQSNQPIELLGVQEKSSLIYFLKSQNEIKNLWVFDLKLQKEKQITFGSLASAIYTDNRILMQYINEPGVWEISEAETSPRKIDIDFPANSKMLSESEGKLYFITGGKCRESDIFSLDFNTGIIQKTLQRPSTLVNTTSFNPNKGSLQTECYIPESNLGLLK